MASSDYELQVVRRGNKQVVARWPPGLADERDLVEAIVERARAKGVGLLKTEAHTLAAFRDAFQTVLRELKASVRP